MRIVDPPARHVNRTAVVIRPREPYCEWARGVDDEAPLSAEISREECSVYLVPEVAMMNELDSWLRQHAGAIFERELSNWHRDADAWPADRSFEAFGRWFEVDAATVVIDLCKSRLRIETF